MNTCEGLGKARYGYLFFMLMALAVLIIGMPVSIQAAIVDKVLLGDHVYLLDDGNNMIYRYNLSAGAFDTPVTLSGSGVTAFDTEDGVNFYVAQERDLIHYSMSDAGIGRSTLRRAPEAIVDLDLNGGFVVLAYGSSGSEMWSVRITDGDLISRVPSPDVTTLRSIQQFHYIEGSGVYVVRLGNGPVIHVTFDASSGVFLKFDAFDQLEATGAVSATDALFFSSDHKVAVSGSAKIYLFSDNSFAEPPNGTAFLSLSDVVYGDETIDALASDSNFFYVAETIDNQCNTRLNGSRVGLYDVSGTSVHFHKSIDFDESLSEIVAYNETIFGFYFDSTGTVLSAVSFSNAEGRTDTVDTSLNPNAEKMTINQDKVKVLGDASVILNIDEGCKHYMVEYDAQKGAYDTLIEVFRTVPAFDVHSAQNRIYWVTGGESIVTFHYADFDEITDASPTPKRVDATAREATVNAVLALDSHIVVQYANADGVAVLEVFDLDLNSLGIISDEATVIGAWTYAVWDAQNKNIYFSAGGKLYSLNVSEVSGVTPVSLPIESVHFGVVTTADLSQPLLLSDVKTPERDLLLIQGNMYDVGSAGLIVDDSTDITLNLSAWTGVSLYTGSFGEDGLIQRWEFDAVNSDDPIKIVGVSDVVGTSVALVSVAVNGEREPLLVTSQTDGSLLFTVGLEESETLLENNNAPTPAEVSDSSSSTTDSVATQDTCKGICPKAGGCLNFVWIGLLLLGGCCRSFFGKRRLSLF